MKKILLSFVLLLAALSMAAIPARPGPIRVTQPDGSVITIYRHGDEFGHWTTDAQGRVVRKGADGFYRPVPGVTAQTARRQAAVRRQMMGRRPAFHPVSGIAFGQKHFLVILVAFSDLDFATTDPNTAFSNLLNQQGYSANGGKGSARDYYYENSGGKFEPVFDVYGPVKLTHDKAYYGGNNSDGDDQRPEQAVAEACEALDGQVDFANYDNDGDGKVDLVFMYYAGYGEADSEDEDAIWPHQWELSYGGIELTLDNMVLDSYACSNELEGMGTYVDKMCGIGTACHEFGHAMGLPDFYDTDYDTNGIAAGPFDFSLMAGGAYNGEGRVPPYFGIEERILLGWLDASVLKEFPKSGNYTLPPVQENKAYKTPADVDGEYFIYECRGESGWDAALPAHGLLVYHVDKSEVRTVQVYDQANGRNVAVTPHDLWYDWETYNCINANASHPCFYLVPAAKQGQVSYSSDLAYSPGKIPFPGTEGVNTFTPADWEKSEALYSIGQIRLENGNVSMKVQRRIRSLGGKVKDLSGNPVAGATVTLTLPEPEAAAAARRLIRRVSGEPLAVTATDRNGDYSFDLTEVEGSTFLVAVSAEGYFGSSRNVTLNGLSTTAGFVLRGLDEPEISDLSKFNPDATPEGVGFGYAGDSIMGAVCFTSEELAPFAGRRIDAISFMYTSSSVKGAYGIVDFGSSRVATVPVSAPVSEQWNTVDVSGEGLRIPDGEDVWFGYALEESKNGYPLLVDESGNEAGGFYYSSFSLTSSSWKESTGNILVSVSLAPSEIDLAYLGFNYIENPKDGVYADGDYFALRLVESYRKRFTAVQWFYDDEPVAGDTVRLRAGTHVVEARLTLSDGSSKVVELPLTVR
jgi:M6 family metalloprotease-like protein